MGASDYGGGRRALQGRIDRLDQLVRGLAREVLFWQEDMGPLLYVERKQYLGAIHEALSGLDRARVTLARARQCLEGLATGGSAGVRLPDDRRVLRPPAPGRLVVRGSVVPRPRRRGLARERP
jgi:hypothetical protein